MDKPRGNMRCGHAGSAIRRKAGKAAFGSGSVPPQPRSQCAACTRLIHPLQPPYTDGIPDGILVPAEAGGSDGV